MSEPVTTDTGELDPYEALGDAIAHGLGFVYAWAHDAPLDVLREMETQVPDMDSASAALSDLRKLVEDRDETERDWGFAEARINALSTQVEELERERDEWEAAARLQNQHAGEAETERDAALTATYKLGASLQEAKGLLERWARLRREHSEPVIGLDDYADLWDETDTFLSSTKENPTDG